MVRRLIAPPTVPIPVPFTADRTEHVASHHVGAPLLEQILRDGDINRVCHLPKVPGVQQHPADAERVVLALVGTSKEAVHRDGYVCSDFAHALSDDVRAEKSSRHAQEEPAGSDNVG